MNRRRRGAQRLKAASPGRGSPRRLPGNDPAASWRRVPRTGNARGGPARSSQERPRTKEATHTPLPARTGHSQDRPAAAGLDSPQPLPHHGTTTTRPRRAPPGRVGCDIAPLQHRRRPRPRAAAVSPRQRQRPPRPLRRPARHAHPSSARAAARDSPDIAPRPHAHPSSARAAARDRPRTPRAPPDAPTAAARRRIEGLGPNRPPNRQSTSPVEAPATPAHRSPRRPRRPSTTPHRTDAEPR